jgi:hypothetical protein
MASARTWLAMVVPALAGCGAQQPALTPAAQAVVLGDAAPPDGYVEVRSLDVTDGQGCGVFGRSGSREGARQKLRAEAAKLGASYVRITEAEEPKPNHQCLEHQYKLHGIAYRTQAQAPAVAAAASAPTLPAPTSPVVLQDYEGGAALGKPARATETSNLSISLVASVTSSNALSVAYTCQGDDQRASLDVWNDAPTTDWRGHSSLSLKLKPDAAISLSVSFMDGNHTGYTQHSEPLTPGVWQAVTLPLAKFWHNPFGPPGDKPGAPVDLSNVQSFGFAPLGCTNGHFLIDDIQLTGAP